MSQSQVPNMTDEEIREHLRLKYLPTAEGFDVCAVETYAHFLALTRSEQRLYIQTLSDIEHELFVELGIHPARAAGFMISARLP